MPKFVLLALFVFVAAAATLVGYPIFFGAHSSASDGLQNIAVPEPSAFILGGIGLAALARIIRSKIK